MEKFSQLKKLICKVFGHKYQKSWKSKNCQWCYGATRCMRCDYSWQDKQKIYFSKGG